MLLEYIHLGGTIAYVLLAMSVVGVTTILWKVWSFWRFNKSVQKTLPKKIIDKILRVNPDHHILLESVRTEINLAFKPLNRGLTTVENIASAAPLLGLLGTVGGIFEAFSQIVSKGMDDPAVFADGIRLALITTVIGLIVAIPHVVSFNYLNAKIEDEQDEVENEVLEHLSIHLKEK